MSSSVLIFYSGTVRVLTSTLVPPRIGYTLRNLDVEFASFVQSEMVQRPMNFGKPLIVVAQGVKDPKDFREDELDSLLLEVIGGNHRREALKNIISDEQYKFVDVQIFCG